MRVIFIGLVFGCAGVVGCRSGGENSMGAASSKSARTYRAIEERYFVEFLKRNPVVATYLGGDAYRPDLADLAGNLRDLSPAALESECRFYDSILEDLEDLPAISTAPVKDDEVDRLVVEAQIRFMLHQVRDRRYHLRSLDTYSIEAFRGVDWQIQGMTDLSGGHYGTEAEWRQVVRRVRAIPRYLEIARANLELGARAGETPDWRMIERDGFKTCASNAEYFRKELPELAERYLDGKPYRAAIVKELSDAGARAGDAFSAFRGALASIYYEPGSVAPEGGAPPRDLLRPEFRADRFAMGEAEYDWALRNNIAQTETAAQLFAYAEGIVKKTEEEMVRVAIEVSGKRGLGIEWGTPEKDRAGVRAVMAKLGEDAPKDDAELTGWYRDACFRLVAYGREQALFDVPTEYKLDVVETPPVLLSSIDGAAYYPAPPFKKTGVGRFYVSPTGNDPAKLRANNRASIADLSAHEGFPGHDWDYQFMRMHPERIGKVRWLTPGAVEDSSSMWEDSMRTEGWALYSEALMAEPKPGKPHGFYSPEERLYQLQGQLLRDVRVRVDTAIHTGRMSFDQAADYFAAHVDFFPEARAKAASDADARASLETAEGAMFRYSKWPTQAITYHLGKRSILELRADVEKIQGAAFDLRAFHERVLGSGTIPIAYLREQILDWARKTRRPLESR